MKVLRRAKACGDLSVYEYETKRPGRHLAVGDYDCEVKLHIYAPTEKEDDFYEIGGVLGSRKEWARVFREVGIR